MPGLLFIYNAATIRGRLLFKVQTSRLLFISALPQCGDYSRAATIRSTDAAATIYFSSTAMRRLFGSGYYSKYRRRDYYLFQLYRNAATIRGAAFIRGNTVYTCNGYNYNILLSAFFTVLCIIHTLHTIIIII